MHVKMMLLWSIKKWTRWDKIWNHIRQDQKVEKLWEKLVKLRLQ